MKTQTLGWAAGAMLSLLAACSPPKPAADVKSEIETAAAAWQTAYNAGDAAAVGALYAEDAHLMPPGMEAISGRGDIQAFWQAAMDGGLARVDLVTEDVFPGDATAAEVGRAIIYGAGGTSPGSSKYVVIWGKTPEGWRILRDIWNENQVPPPAGGETPGS
jgi:uncharacterized protein (TIGR02246 family)